MHRRRGDGRLHRRRGFTVQIQRNVLSGGLDRPFELGKHIGADLLGLLGELHDRIARFRERRDGNLSFPDDQSVHGLQYPRHMFRDRNVGRLLLRARPKSLEIVSIRESAS